MIKTLGPTTLLTAKWIFLISLNYMFECSKVFLNAGFPVSWLLLVLSF